MRTREKAKVKVKILPKRALKSEEIIQMLKELEKRAIVFSMGMISYNPSIGRVLRKGGGGQFVEIAWEMIRKMEEIRTQAEFDEWHGKFVESVRHRIETTARGKPISYGQAQKPVNVFLKVYVDWANLPNSNIATRLRSFLHVPLDSVVMERVKALFGRYCKGLRLNPLRNIDKSKYNSWQQCFRKICPDKPLLLDVLWAAKSFENVFKRTLKEERAEGAE